MTGRKILFLDIDDTLLTRSKKVTPENALAIRKALEAGHLIVICTGRPHSGAIGLAEETGLAGPGCFLISYNGGQIYDCSSGKNIYRKTLRLEDVRLLFQEADALGLHIQAYTDQEMLVRRVNRETEFYRSSVRIPYRVMPELPDGMTEEPCKVLAIDLDETGVLEEFHAAALSRVGDRIRLFTSNPWYMECAPKGISKGEAVLRLCAHTGIPVERSVSAGDSENDLEMIAAAGIGCAMANATEGCRAAADYVTEKDCDHSGVAEIIERFILA